ncbi:MAG: MarR family transcriptional regulator [Solirubrobacterales bacterium]|nr:MarR family transcriptional regulator [Solirubrobacterales bacterium]
MSRSAPDSPTELTGGLLAVSTSFKQAYRTLRRRKGRETHRLNDEISHAQFELLVELRHRGPLPISELAKSSGLSPASVSQMVDRLEEQGQVERIRSEEDRRIVTVELSDRGRETIEPVVAAWRQKWLDAFDGVDEADLLTASRVLDRIATIYDADPEGR